MSKNEKYKNDNIIRLEFFPRSCYIEINNDLGIYDYNLFNHLKKDYKILHIEKPYESKRNKLAELIKNKEGR